MPTWPLSRLKVSVRDIPFPLHHHLASLPTGFGGIAQKHSRALLRVEPWFPTSFYGKGIRKNGLIVPILPLLFWRSWDKIDRWEYHQVVLQNHIFVENSSFFFANQKLVTCSRVSTLTMRSDAKHVFDGRLPWCFSSVAIKHGHLDSFGGKHHGFIFMKQNTFRLQSDEIPDCKEELLFFPPPMHERCLLFAERIGGSSGRAEVMVRWYYTDHCAEDDQWPAITKDARHRVDWGDLDGIKGSVSWDDGEDGVKCAVEKYWLQNFSSTNGSDASAVLIYSDGLVEVGEGFCGYLEAAEGSAAEIIEGQLPFSVLIGDRGKNGGFFAEDIIRQRNPKKAREFLSFSTTGAAFVYVSSLKKSPQGPVKMVINLVSDLYGWYSSQALFLCFFLCLFLLVSLKSTNLCKPTLLHFSKSHNAFLHLGSWSKVEAN